MQLLYAQRQKALVTTIEHHAEGLLSVELYSGGIVAQGLFSVTLMLLLSLTRCQPHAVGRGI